MSSRRSRSRISDDQIADLVSKLQQLIPEIRNRRSDKEYKMKAKEANSRQACQQTYLDLLNCHYRVFDRSCRGVSASKVLQETCNYIRNLHREVDGLSERLSQLLESTDSDSAQAAIIRSLLM